MPIDINNKRFCIFGLQGSGKSVLVKHILSNVRNSFVYDVLKEHSGHNRYLATHRQVKRPVESDPAIVELNKVVNRIVIGSGQIRLFILEEANRYCRNRYPLPSSILDLNDFQRHDKIAFGCVSRRPVQLNTDIVELAHYLFIYNLAGKNDIDYLESISEGLGETVRKLPPYHFVLVNQDRSYQVHAPVPFGEKTVAGGADQAKVFEPGDMTNG